MSGNALQPQRGGLPFALGAHLVWGLLPLHLMLVRHVPAFEFVAWRVLFTLPFCLAIIALRRQGPELRAALANWKVLRLLVLSALLIWANWTVYVAAIQAGHVFAASLGYYLTPLLQVLAGTVLLGEALSRRQWIAVVLSGLGVALLARGALDMLGVSLALALSWSSYGLVRRFVPVGSLPGLTVETMVLALPAMGGVLLFAGTPAGSSFGHDLPTSALIAAAGAITAVPLLLFAIAARRMDFSALGMVQFTSPTVVFLLGLTMFGEPLDPLRLTSFAIIWAAIALFVWDLIAARRKSADQAPA